MTLTKGHRSRSNVQKLAKILKNGPYLKCYFTYRLGTKVQPIKVHSMTQVPMTKGQGQIFPKMGKKQRTGHISEAISQTDFILGTKVQPIKAHSMIHISMTLTEGQVQRSWSNFPQNG